MTQSLHVDLDRLSMMLSIDEVGCEVRYRLNLSPDRATVDLLREVCEGYRVIESYEEKQLPLGALCADQSREDALIWAARGFLGLPLKFGKSE